MPRMLTIAAFCVTALFSLSANAVDRVTGAVIGSYNAFTWPAEIGIAKGFYADQGLDMDVIFVPSAPASLQQLAAGSLDLSISTGLVDPLRLVSHGGLVALARVHLRISPYVLVASHDIKDIASLKGKTIAIGSKADITHVLIEKMLASAGLAFTDVDMVYSGSTASRYAALKTGAIAASLLAVPLNYMAESEGFQQLGVAGNYAKDMPFTGSIINRKWAEAHPDTARRLFAINDQSIEWFYDKANRDEAIRILIDAGHITPEDATRSYEFLHDGEYFDRTHKVSRRGVEALVAALHELGDTDISPTPEQVVIPSLTVLSD